MLDFDIDITRIDALASELAASDKQVRFAFSRALRRTAATLRRMSSKGLKSELQLRNAKALRKRLRTIKVRRNGDEIQLWYGSNDMAVSAFKGRPRQTASGVSFRDQDFANAFIGRRRDGQRSIFRRTSRRSLPVREQTMPVKDRVDVYLEDEVFTEVETIFFKHFRADLRARTLYGAGSD